MSIYQPPNGGATIDSVILVGADNQPVSLSGGGSSGAGTSTPSLVRAAPVGTVTIAAGAFEVSIASVGETALTVMGASLNPGETVTYRAASVDAPLGQITYDGAAGSVALVSKIVVEVA